MKDQVEILIQYYNVILSFQKSLLVREVLTFHFLKSWEIQRKNWLTFKTVKRIGLYAKQLDLKYVKFSVHKKDYTKIEKQNYISISVFYEDKTQYRIYASKQNFDLLLLSNSKNSYYFLIKDFESFMTSKTKHRGKKVFVDIV